MPTGPLSPASWHGSTAPVPGTFCRFGYEPWARWNEPPHADICHGGLPSTNSLEGNWISCLVLIRVFVPTWRDWEGSYAGEKLVNELQDVTQIVPGWSPRHKMAPMRLAPQATGEQCPEAGPVLWNQTCQQPWLRLLVLESPPAQPQDRWVGFSSLSWLFLVLLESLFFPLLFLSPVCVLLFPWFLKFPF